VHDADGSLVVGEGYVVDAKDYLVQEAVAIKF
jgi:hypothetical protein